MPQKNEFTGGEFKSPHRLLLLTDKKLETPALMGVSKVSRQPAESVQLGAVQADLAIPEEPVGSMHSGLRIRRQAGCRRFQWAN